MKEVNVEDLTLEDTLHSYKIKDMLQCPKCSYMFNKEDNTYEITRKGSSPLYVGFDSYVDDEFEYEETIVECPNCGDKDVLEDYPNAYTDDIENAVNAEEILPGITNYINNMEEE